MYIALEDYVRWYSPIPENIFERLAIEACCTMDKYTTGLDNVRKLKEAFPVDEDAENAVKFTAARLVNTLYQIYEAEQAASMGRGYVETENGLQRKIISRVEAGNEAISYMEGQNATTAIKNKDFWLAAIPALLLLAQTVAALFGFTLDLGEVGDKLLAVVNAVFALLAILGIVNDPTTAGISDSKQARTYISPRED